MEKPLAVLDVETTGLNLETDKIVQIAVTKVSHDLKTIIERKSALINPQIPISKEAMEVHGITDEMVTGRPIFPQIARSLAEFLSGCNIGGFNILNFDIPLTAEEFFRCGIEWPEKGTKFIDVCAIFHTKESRDLTGAAKFYLSREHMTAHDAAGDVDTTIDVLAAQLAKYEDLGKMTIEELAKFCMPENRLDLAGKIIRNEAGVAVFSFGKDKGKPVRESIGFANWMLKGNFPSDTKRVIKQVLGWTEKTPKAKP